MKTIKIDIPKGHEVEDFDKESGVIKFRPTPKEITEKIKTLDDAIGELGEKDPEVVHYRKLQGADVEGHILNYQRCVIIAKALNEGWTPDWDNSSEAKYIPWFEMGSSAFRFGGYASWFTASHVGSRLCFKSRKLAEYAGKQFTSYYKEYMLIK